MLVRYSVLADASGSFGGLVASHNRAGQYIRTRVRPTNPSSPAQLEIRTIFANLSAAWQGLTDAQREAWTTYACNVPISGRFGDPLHLTGHQMYIRRNSIRIQATLARIDDGPTVFTLDLLSPVTLVADETGNLLTVSFSETDAWVTEDNAGLLVYGSRSVALTIAFFNAPYRFGAPILGQVAIPETSPVPLANPFKLSQGNAVYTRVRSVRADGRISAIQFLDRAIIGP